MRKNVFKWMALLLVAIVGVCLTSCKGNDGPELEPISPGEITAGNLVGTWEFFDNDGSRRMVVTIKGDGTYAATQYEDGQQFGGSGKWKFEDGYLSIELPDGWDKYKVVSVSTKEFVLRNFPVNGDCVWKRK